MTDAPQPTTTERWFADCCILDPDGLLTVDEVLASTAEWASESRTRRPTLPLAVVHVLGQSGVTKGKDANAIAGVRLRRAGE